jgi:hypothetical protein
MKEIARIILFLILAPIYMTLALFMTFTYDWWCGLADFS